MSRLAAAPLALAAVFALAACQDPAGVGLGLIDEDQSSPSVRIIPLAGLDTLQSETVAIGIAAASATPSQARVLVGDVVDPVFGDARAVAYVDFLQPDVGSLEAADVVNAWVELRRDYAYGDTTSTLPVALSAISGSWEVDTDYAVDTLFATGPVLSTTDLVATADSLQRFDLPASWVQANAATLVGDTFDSFEGFALSTAPGFVPAPGVVFGFGTFVSSGSGLRVATPDDTLFYPLSEVFTSVAATPALTATTGPTLPIRASSRSALQFTVSLDDVPQTALARATLRIPLDASVLRDGPFVRPLAVGGFLLGVRRDDAGDESRVALGNLEITDTEAILSDTRVLTTALQDFLFDPTSSGFVRYEVVPVGNAETNAVSLSVLPVVRPGLSAEDPRVTLTLVGTAGASATAQP